MCPEQIMNDSLVRQHRYFVFSECKYFSSHSPLILWSHKWQGTDGFTLTFLHCETVTSSFLLSRRTCQDLSQTPWSEEAPHLCSLKCHCCLHRSPTPISHDSLMMYHHHCPQPTLHRAMDVHLPCAKVCHQQSLTVDSLYW